MPFSDRIPKALLTIWKKLRAVLEAFGNVISTIFLWVFYFTVFAIFALPIKWMRDPFGKKTDTSFVTPRRSVANAEHFRDES